MCSRKRVILYAPKTSDDFASFRVPSVDLLMIASGWFGYSILPRARCAIHSTVSTIYRGINPEDKVAFVVKLSSDPDSTDAEHEHNILKTLCHPNIISLYPVRGLEPFLVLRGYRFHLGEILSSARDHQLTLDQRASLMGDVAAACAYIVSQGIVHGDIKLANILVGEDTDETTELVAYRAVLCDFGYSHRAAMGAHANIADTNKYTVKNGCGLQTIEGNTLYLTDMIQTTQVLLQILGMMIVFSKMVAPVILYHGTHVVDWSMRLPDEKSANYKYALPTFTLLSDTVVQEKNVILDPYKHPANPRQFVNRLMRERIIVKDPFGEPYIRSNFLRILLTILVMFPRTCDVDAVNVAWRDVRNLCANEARWTTTRRDKHPYN